MELKNNLSFLLIHTLIGGLIVMFINDKYIIIGAVIGLAIGLLRIFQKQRQTKQTRYIPDWVKKEVLLRQYHMCALCIENQLLEFDHRMRYADGGDNTPKNIVALCPKHHAMKTRLDSQGYSSFVG